MTRTDSRLALALTLSLLTHFLPFLPDLLHRSPQTMPPPEPLQAMLRPMPDQPPLMLAEPETARPPVTSPHPPASAGKPQAARRADWQQEIRRQFARQQQRGEFYPPEAIDRGLEGEVLVLLILDPEGHVAAARVEQGSGHRLLDEAALRAVRALHSLPADAPRETLVPVRFRLD